MDRLALSIVYKFSVDPTKLTLREIHEFLKSYPSDKLEKSMLIFFNAIFTEIRKLNDLSVECVSELLFLIKSIKSFTNAKILCLVLEEIVTFLQKYIVRKSATKDYGDFSCIDLELARDVLQICSVILSHSRDDEQIEKIIYSPSSVVTLSYVVAFLLHYVGYNRERELQTEALSCLTSIAHPGIGAESTKPQIVVNVAPGIFQCLAKVISADRKVGSVVKSRAVQCLGSLVVLLYGDKASKPDKTGRRGLLAPQIDWWSTSPQELASLVVTHMDAWRKDNWNIVAKVIRIAKHSILERPEPDHWRVRLELARVSQTILEQCSWAHDCTTDLVECLIVLCADTDVAVSEQACRAITAVSVMQFSIDIHWDAHNTNRSTVHQSGSLMVATVARDNLDKVIGAMTALCITPSDDIKCNVLQIVDGYLAIFANQHLPSPSCIQIKQILIHLISLCKIDNIELDLFEPAYASNEMFTTPESHLQTSCEFFHKTFAFFHNEKVYKTVRSILCRVVSVVEPNSLIALLQSLTQDQPDDIAAILLVSKLVVRALIDNTLIQSDKKIALCKSILTTYFDYEIMNLATSNEAHGQHLARDFWKDSVAAIDWKCSSNSSLVPCSSNRTPQILKQNTLVLTVVMELCATCCLLFKQCFINEDTDSWLMRTCLFEVMNKAQQSPHLLSQAATRCLQIMSTVNSKYQSSLSVLLRFNGDYIMDSISRRLRSAALVLKTRSRDEVVLRKVEGACRCLTTLCCHSCEDTMPVLQTILNQLFYCLDETHGACNQLFMSVLKEAVRAICRWKCVSTSRKLSDSTGLTTTQSNCEQSDVTKCRQFLAERNNVLISSGLRKDPNEEYIEHIEEFLGDDSYFKDQDETREPEKAEPSQMTVAITSIINRCVNLLSSSNAQIRLSCLEIMIDAVNYLQSDNDTLSIVVHQIWEPLGHRLFDREYPVIIKAFELVNEMARLCGNFVYVKIKDSFISTLCTLLERCASISASHVASTKYTGIYRLQSSLLSFLSQLCHHTDVRGFDLEQVVESFLSYLDDHQPYQLVEACKTSLKVLFKNDPGLVWFKLAQIKSMNQTESERNASQIFGHVARSYDSHYLENVEMLLHEFDISN